jgi:hypothetical protein
MEKDYTITRLTWHTKRKGNEGREAIYRGQFITLMRFLHENGLLTKPINLQSLESADDIVLTKSDLTDKGFRLIQTGYQKWLGYLDRPNNSNKYTNISHLQKGLDEINKASSS